jgi:hypothetical protein
MSISKTVVILANSIKHHPCTCIAGREILEHSGHYEIGPWIRPVSTHDEGGLYPSESRLTNGKNPAVFDLVQIDLEKQLREPTQPENWGIAKGTIWKKVAGKYGRPRMNLLVEAPPSLWLEKNQPTDRISAATISRNPPAQSLYLFHVESARIQLGWRQWGGEYKPRRRALFTLNGQDYDLGITDSHFLDIHRSKVPPKGADTREFEIDDKEGCYLVTSLAPAFNGYHYKVVATIIEASQCQTTPPNNYLPLATQIWKRVRSWISFWKTESRP